MAALYAIAITPAETAPVSPEVVLESGAVRGEDRDALGVLAFKGMPYAAPPVGELRWRSPKPPLAWAGVRQAMAFSPHCMTSMRPLPPQSYPESEDCLTINIWTAARAPGEKRPVMVWIPGGGFVVGGSSMPNFEGTLMAAKGVVLVSFNYRLGVYGFLSHPALDREGAPSGNFGLQDQIAALKWVRANIARFGGDPTNVTIFGESAGAMSVGLLMTSPEARGLFHKGIAESGAFWDSNHGSIPTRAETQARGVALADRLAGGDIDRLRAIPAETLSRETVWGRNMNPQDQAFSPNIDGFVITGDPASMFAQGREADVPFLAGWNASEGATFVSLAWPHANAAQFRSAAAARLGADHMTEFLKVYPAENEAEVGASSLKVTGDLVIAEQTWEALQLHRSTALSPSYGYYFSLTSPYTPVAEHTVEIDYVFGHLKPHWLGRAEGDPSPGPRDRELAEQMISYWTNFARSGDPNGPGLPVWPQYQGEHPELMVFGDSTAAAPEGPDMAVDRFHFIRSLRANGRLPQTLRESAPAAP